MRRLALVLASVLSLVAGCRPYIRVHPLNPSPHPLVPRPADKVEELLNAPTRAYVEVAELESPDPDALRTKAGAIGCEGLIITHEGTGKQDFRVATCFVWNP